MNELGIWECAIEMSPVISVTAANALKAAANEQGLFVNVVSPSDAPHFAVEARMPHNGLDPYKAGNVTGAKKLVLPKSNYPHRIYTIDLPGPQCFNKTACMRNFIKRRKLAGRHYCCI